MKALFVGLDGVGRTAALYWLKIGEHLNMIPTVGFNTESIDIGGGTKLDVFDLSGVSKVRQLWTNYFAGTQIVAFFVDSTDRERLDEAREELWKMLLHAQLAEAIFVIFANKQDLPGAMTAAQVHRGLELGSAQQGHPIKAFPSTSRNGTGLREGLQWAAQAFRASRSSAKDDKKLALLFGFGATSRGLSLGRLKSILFSDGRTPDISDFSGIDPSTFDVETRDDSGETVLHWAARCAAPAVVEDLVKVAGFDVNAREFKRGRTPLFMAATEETAERLIELGASNEVDLTRERADAELAKRRLMVSRRPPQLQPAEVTVITVAVVGAGCLGRHPISEAIVLASTLSEQTPSPEKGVTGKDRFRPERFSWSQQKPATEADERDPGEIPIVWVTSGEEPEKRHLCIRIGPLNWITSKKEPPTRQQGKIDVVIFAHSIMDPQSIAKLSQLADDVDRTQHCSGATKVMLGIGKEVRTDQELVRNLSLHRINILGIEQCRSVARHIRMCGFVESSSGPKAIREAVIQCTRVHITQRLLAFSSSAPAGFAIEQFDTPSPMLPPPLENDEELKEVKVLILGHQATGKTTLLRRLVEEEARQSKGVLKRIGAKLSKMTQPKSTIGVKFKEMTNVVRGVTLRVLDFAGQTEYSTIFEHFLSPFAALYVVVVNAAAEDPRKQVNHWMHTIQTNAKGPRIGAGLLIICTMVDLVRGGPEAIAARESEITKEVMMWGIASQFKPMVEIVMTSNETGHGLERVWKSLGKMAQQIAATKVPHALKRAQEQVVKRAMEGQRMFLNLEEIKAMIDDRKTKKEIELHEAWEELAQHLHAIGVAVFEPESSTVCMKVEALARVMSAFVAPDHHIQRLFDVSSGITQFRSDRVTQEEAIARIQKVKGIDKIFRRGTPDEELKRHCESAISFMKLCKLCFEVSAEENGGLPGLMFPTLRVACDLFSVPFGRSAEKGGKILGVRLRSTRKDLGASAFSRALVELCQKLDTRFTVFSNCAVLVDQPTETRFFVALRSPSSTQGSARPQPLKSAVGDAAPSASAAPVPAEPAVAEVEESEIVVVAQGRAPEKWRETIGKGFLDMCDITDPLCPMCAQRDFFNTLSVSMADVSATPEDVPGTSESHAANAPPLKCRAGHGVNPADVQSGVAVDDSFAWRNKLWSPLHGDAFFEAEPEKWRKGGCALITELTDQETNEARRAEYMRARAEFFKFVGVDVQNRLTLEKIEFIRNDTLEENFAGFFKELVKKVTAHSQSDLPQLKMADESEETKKWRRWVLGQLEKSRVRVSGEEGVNLILGWHGSSESSIRAIASTGFIEPHQIEASGITPTDPGYFAKGLYFTQSPSYGAKYAARKKSHCLLLSWVLMGQVYPAVESPGGEKKLTERVKPFDSHYVIIGDTGFPLNPFKDPKSGEELKDEIVVFKTVQVLPRFIFHFSYRPTEVPKEYQTARPLVLWIDSGIQSVERNSAALKHIIPKMVVEKCKSTAEAKVWLCRFGKMFSTRLCVITNRFREHDGGDLAWQQTISMVRELEGLETVQVVVFCGNVAKANASCSGKWRQLVITSEVTDLEKILKQF